jgi:hypothetical protein
MASSASQKITHGVVTASSPRLRAAPAVRRRGDRITRTGSGLVLAGAGFAVVIGTINSLQGIPSGFGWLVGSVAAILTWRGVRDRF